MKHQEDGFCDGTCTDDRLPITDNQIHLVARSINPIGHISREGAHAGWAGNGEESGVFEIVS